MSYEHFRRLERMYLGANINREVYKGTSIHIEEGKAVIEVPISETFHHAANAMHGSVYFKMLDDAAYFAAASLAEDVFLLTTRFQVELKRPFMRGVIRCEGRLEEKNEDGFQGSAILWNEDGKVLATGSGTFVRGRSALTPAIGYE
ncbi:MAG: PaaI family thioesterase [Flavobacteriales bacterium]|nr:PaaI family thioesterase [Flavobacteriales bacterium]